MPQSLQEWASDPNPKLTVLSVERDRLPNPEREIFDRWSDGRGIVNRDVDYLLHKTLVLRRVIADLVANAGSPREAESPGRFVATVPTEALEAAAGHGDFSGHSDEETELLDAWGIGPGVGESDR